MKYSPILLLILLAPVAAQDDNRLKGILERVERLEREVERLRVVEEKRPATIDELLAAARRGDKVARRKLLDIRNQIDAVLNDANRRRAELARKAAAALERTAEFDALRKRAAAARQDLRARAERKDVPDDVIVEEPIAKKKETGARYIEVLRRQKTPMKERYDAVVNLARFPGSESLKELTRVLENDENALVRRAAAWSLGQHKSVVAIPVLIGQIDNDDPYVGYMCVRSLTEITKADFGFDPTWEMAQRVEVKKKWTAWHQKNRAR